MKIESLNEYCKSLFELFSIPMIIYHNKTGKILSGFFFDNSFTDLMINNPQITKRYLGTTLFDDRHDVQFYISDDKIAFGSVRDKASSYCIYIGPCLLADANEQMMHSMLTRSNSPFRNNPNKYYEEIYNYIKSLPRLTAPRFLWILSFVNNCLNHEVADPGSFNQVSISKNRIDISEASLNETKQNDAYDTDAYDMFMEELKALILNGSQVKVLDLWNDNAARIVYEPIRKANVEDSLRYSKNMFIIFMNDISNILNAHGISKQLTREICNSLLSDIENCIIVQQTEAVYHKALTYFTDLVNTLNLEKHKGNLLVQKAINYIHDNINEPISAQDISDHLGISAGYLSAVFNRELKMKISDYVNTQKIAVAESLLINTDADIIDISSYLSFSSQSHFNNIFKKVTGITPLKYRRLRLEKTSR